MTGGECRVLRVLKIANRVCVPAIKDLLHLPAVDEFSPLAIDDGERMVGSLRKVDN